MKTTRAKIELLIDAGHKSLHVMARLAKTTPGYVREIRDRKGNGRSSDRQIYHREYMANLRADPNYRKRELKQQAEYRERLRKQKRREIMDEAARANP